MSIDSKIKHNIPMADFTTFKIGGTAKYFIEIKTREELEEVFNWIKEKKVNYCILSGGSNILINDNGIDGIVLKMANDKIKIENTEVICGAGSLFTHAIRQSVFNSLTGLEWGIGIPGSVGGAVRGNSGAFGKSMENIVKSVEVYNSKKNEFQTLNNKNCNFGYRHSVFKEESYLIIWEVILELKKGDEMEIKKLMDKYIVIRSDNYPKLPNAGCIFKNVEFDKLQEANPELAQKVLNEKIARDNLVSTGWIINQAGLTGKTIGGAKISLQHGNFIVNTGKATAEDVAMLISYIKQQIRKLYNIQLQEEVQYLGF